MRFTVDINEVTTELGLAGLHGTIHVVKDDVVECVVLSNRHGFPMDRGGVVEIDREHITDLKQPVKNIRK